MLVVLKLGVIVEVKFDMVFVVKLCWEVKVMYYGKLKKCDVWKLLKWLVDYMRLW